MFVELHLVQNFAPSCLNRDDTNSPKECEFGGYRRARISSQCIKRAVRRCFREQQLLPPQHLAERSKQLVGAVADLLQKKGRDQGEALARVEKALAGVQLKADEAHETQYLLFLGQQEIAGLADVVHANWDALAPAPPPAAGDKKKSAREQKAEAQKAVPDDVVKKVKEVFNGGKAADVALFGRMLADQAGLNRDAACQVAHALSTNRVSMEMDFYTAVDDLKERSADSDAGAGMLGTVEFNSACFYRYADIDFDQLTANLQGDVELARKTVGAFLTASVHALPTGKQNTFAAHNPPSLVLAVVRDRGLFSLANAFEKPVWPAGGSLVQKSIEELDRYWARLVRMYGTEGLRVIKVCLLDESIELKALAANKVNSVREVFDAVQAVLPNGKEAR
jgi:CRISPR system Cascade subunit CasC